jgi:hypothetical protein
MIVHNVPVIIGTGVPWGKGPRDLAQFLKS